MPRCKHVRGTLTSIAHSLAEPRSFGVYGAVQGVPHRRCASVAPHAPNGNPRRHGLSLAARTQLRSRTRRLSVRNVRSSPSEPWGGGA